MDNEDAKQEQAKSSPVYDFYYEKSFGYRAVHGDGFVVSPNAKGSIAITFYSERLAIPKHVQLNFNEVDDAGVVEEKFVDGKKGVLRQMEFTAFIDIDTAEELREWLEKAVSVINKQPEDDRDTTDE